MNEQIKSLRQQIANLEIAMEELLERAETEQRITHSKFLANHWLGALELLEVQLDNNRALLKRLETVGR